MTAVIRLVLALAPLLTAGGLAWAEPAAPAAGVVVTTKPVHSLVSLVMEGAGTPVLIVDGPASAHMFALKPSVSRAVSESRVFIRVSEETEPFTRRLIEGLPENVRIVTLADARLGVEILSQRDAATYEPHEHGHHGHDENHETADVASPRRADGHIWLDPHNAKAIVTAVAGVLGEVYPEHKERFAHNAATAGARIDAKEAEIAATLSSVRTTPFVVFHDAYQYFERRFGLAAAGSITISPDVQPSAKRLSEVRAKIKALSARCVFAEPGFTPKLVAAMTEGTTARAGTLDPEGQSLTKGPDLYFTLMDGLARGLKDCLSHE